MEAFTAVSAMLAAATAVFAVTLYWAVRKFGIGRRDWIAASVVFVWCAGTGAKMYLDSAAQTSEADPLAAALMLGPIQGPGTAIATPSAKREALPSVATLIGGLEERLEREPADPKGWALLAQSYAFIGNTAAAEQAIVHAVEFGANESELRARVDGASRDAHPEAAGRLASADQ